MTAKAANIANEIQRLSWDDVLALYENLVATIHDRGEAEGLESGFCREIEKRVAEIKSGTAASVDAFEALREM